MNKRLNRILESQSDIIRKARADKGYLKGFSFGEIDAIYTASKGLCAICGNPPTGRKHHLDHCHGSGKLRGILCHNCNVGLGHFKDNVELLAKAIEYLKKYR